MITVFGKEWFKKYNKQLCWLANSFIGQFVFKFNKFGHYLDPNKKITKITPNSVAQYNGLVYKEKTGEKITYRIIKEVECHNDKCEYCNFHDAEYGKYPDDCKDKDCIKGHTIKKTRIKIVTPIYTKLKTPKEEYTEHFFSRNEYALRLQKVFYPIWLLFHGWDMLIANKFKPAWNLGFDTLTVYPDADPESTSVDGYINREGTHLSWSNIRDGVGTVAVDNVASSPFVYLEAGTTDWDKMRRAIFLFDTSALTSGATISAATMSLYGVSKYDGFTTPLALNINIYTSTPATNTALIPADYSQLGTTAQCDAAITYAGWSITGYNDFALNATGLGNISKTSITKFGTRNKNYDVDNVEPTFQASKFTYIRGYYADQGSNKPKLVVTYTTGTDYFKTCSETIAINDTLLNKTSRVFTEAISIIDSISIQKTLKRTLSETITIVDNIDAKKIAVKTLSDIISIVDTIKKSIGKTLTETITIIDSIIFGKVFARTYSEVITIADSIVIAQLKTLSEVISILDTITKKTSKTLNEIITIVDSIATRKILNKTLSDVITIADTVKSKTAKTLSDVITIADSISKITAQVLVETITLVESLYIKLNGVNVKWVRKYSEKVGSFARKYSEKVGTFIKKYYKDI